jgi:hypothetical protein
MARTVPISPFLDNVQVADKPRRIVGWGGDGFFGHI